MAANRGAVTLFFVLLPYCWQELELQFVNTTTGLPTETTSISKNPDEIPGVFGTGADENFQGSGPENYHKTKLSPSNVDRIFNNEPDADENYQLETPEKYHEPQFSSSNVERNSSSEKKNKKDDQYNPLSVLDKILQNLGRPSGNSVKQIEEEKQSSHGEAISYKDIKIA